MAIRTGESSAAVFGLPAVLCKIILHKLNLRSTGADVHERCKLKRKLAKQGSLCAIEAHLAFVRPFLCFVSLGKQSIAKHAAKPLKNKKNELNEEKKSKRCGYTLASQERDVTPHIIHGPGASILCYVN